ncbi:glutathione S-transferase [Hyaloscypha variabilis F]|uniref:glutathione transferase n=1 Tax=Hyaloscypha variabilis (strain UAMH 11265 / GT02V1 / F) TaxID=1149755 RepID=A0A2J6R4Y3_HYAVF|nr:glutathione S-transferase [Hyaloscypha variabilis F]
MSEPVKKPIDLYSIAFPNSPNPWKVAIVLEELGLEYNIILLDMFSVKKAPFTDLNPNGRTPVIVDYDNDGFVLWESTAIIQYLIEKYDTDNRLTYTLGPEKYLLSQWLMFQASGQGVYFGQGVWFTHAHLEKLPSAISRYRKEVRRILGVLDTALEGKRYLVGDKVTIADLSFVAWHSVIPFICMEDTEWVTKGFPNVDRWMGELMERESVKTVLVEKKSLLSKPL